MGEMGWGAREGTGAEEKSWGERTEEKGWGEGADVGGRRENRGKRTAREKGWAIEREKEDSEGEEGAKGEWAAGEKLEGEDEAKGARREDAENGAGGGDGAQ